MTVAYVGMQHDDFKVAAIILPAMS